MYVCFAPCRLWCLVPLTLPGALQAFHDDNVIFRHVGGLGSFGDAMRRGLVLSMDLGDDEDDSLRWLDSNPFPGMEKPKPGDVREPCSPDGSNSLSSLTLTSPKAHAIFSNFRYGELGSVEGCRSTPPPPPPPPPPPCPGGSLTKCIILCSTGSAPAYKACLDSCIANCTSGGATEVKDVVGLRAALQDVSAGCAHRS